MLINTQDTLIKNVNSYHHDKCLDKWFVDNKCKCNCNELRCNPESYECRILEWDDDGIQNTNLNEYNIDYDSFYKSDIRDEKGLPEIISSKSDIHSILLNYINIVNE